MSEDLRRAALDLVLELTVLLHDDMTRSLQADGLTTSRAHVLWVLHARGPCTQRVLAESLGVTPRTITGLVDGLVATGFVTREPHPSDRRATHVTLTERGVATADALAAGHVELADQLFGPLSGADLATFSSALGDVVARLRDLAPTPEVPS